VRDWSAVAIDKRTRDLKEFDARYQKIDSRGFRFRNRLIITDRFGALSECIGNWKSIHAGSGIQIFTSNKAHAVCGGTDSSCALR